MSLWKRMTPITISRSHPYLSSHLNPQSSPAHASMHFPRCCAFRGKAAKKQRDKKRQQPKPPSIPKVARGFAAKPRNSEGDKRPPQPRPSFSPTIRGRSRSRIWGLTFADIPQDERTPAARSAQRGFFHVRGRAGKEGRPRAEHTRQLTRRCKPSCAYPRQHQTEYQSGSREVSS